MATAIKADAATVSGGIRHCARPDIAVFADTLPESSPLYWPALAASDGCEASLRELNEMLADDGCETFAHAPATWGMS